VLVVYLVCLFARRVYIAYLDSVYFFQPKHFRTAVYHEILIGYMDYVKSLGWELLLYFIYLSVVLNLYCYTVTRYLSPMICLM